MALRARTCDRELEQRRMRSIAVGLFAAISISLWIGFAVDTYFAVDGPHYFVLQLDNQWFTKVAWSRAHAEYLTQWPLVCALRSGVRNLKVLELLFGLGLWFPWLLSFVVSLYATRERAELLLLYLISLASLNLAVLVGEHGVLLVTVWPILFFGLLPRPLTRGEQVATGLLLVAHLRLYEAAAATGAIFAAIFAIRAWRAGSRRERITSLLFFFLSVWAVAIAIRWTLLPRDPANRASFVEGMLTALWHPYPWMGALFVVLTAAGIRLGSTRLKTAGWVLPLLIGTVSLLSSGIPTGVAFSTRTCTLTVLPLLMVAAIGTSVARPRLCREVIGAATGLIVGLSFLHVRHLEDWMRFRSDFRRVLSTRVGFVDPNEYGGALVHWGWTNPLLSYVWSEGTVDTIVDHSVEPAWEPFDAHREIVMKGYLVREPTFLED